MDKPTLANNSGDIVNRVIMLKEGIYLNKKANSLFICDNSTLLKSLFLGGGYSCIITILLIRFVMRTRFIAGDLQVINDALMSIKNPLITI